MLVGVINLRSLKKTFREFCIANQDYAKKECAAVKAMNKLIQDAPDIAEEYFDLRFPGLNGKIKKEQAE